MYVLTYREILGGDDTDSLKEATFKTQLIFFPKCKCKGLQQEYELDKDLK